MHNLSALKQFILAYFPDIVVEVGLADITEMRVFLLDTSFLDVWYSPRNTSKYSYHWERQHLDGTIYRHDNAPHVRWQHVATYPKHFHLRTEQNVVESYISLIPEEALSEFLTFVRETIATRN